MPDFKRLLVIGDGVVYRYHDEFYVPGGAKLDIYDIFEGIQEIYIWNKIYDITKAETSKCNRYETEKSSKKIIFCGIENQKKGYMGYCTTLVKRYRKLSVILNVPTLVMFSPVSVSQWILWYCFKQRKLLFMTRMIGDPEGINNVNKPFSRVFVPFIKHVVKNVNREAKLQSWVSAELERKYCNRGVPSVVFNDCLITLEDIVDEIKPRATQQLKLIFVGRLSPEKGIYDLIAAIKEAGDLDIKLTIVGDGVEGERILKLINELSLEDKISCCHMMKWGGALFEMMKKSDCLVLPSYTEGLGMVNVEAMANGIPVIASRVGGIPEVVCDGVNGFLFEAGNVNELRNRIENLYFNEDIRQKMAVNALETARKNTRNMQLEKFREAYHNFIIPYL